MTTTLWRINIKPQNQKGSNPFNYCLRKGILGVGWRVNRDDTASEFSSIEEYRKKGNFLYNQKDKKSFTKAVNALERIKKDDLIWARKDGYYYICKVIGNWSYVDDEASKLNDIHNHIPVEFIKVGSIDHVPAKVINSFIPNATLQRINDESTKIVSKIIYNQLTNTTSYYEISPFFKDSVINYLAPEDVEEVISLYLQITLEYLIYSSTNKLSTELIEFVGISRDQSHRVFVQVKTGNVSLSFDDYESFACNGNKVYLFATSEKYNENNNSNIIKLSKIEIESFIFSHKDFMPKRILYWIDFATNH